MIKQADLDALGNDFERTGKGLIDFLLLDEHGFPLLVLEAKAEHERGWAHFRSARKRTSPWLPLSAGVLTNQS